MNSPTTSKFRAPIILSEGFRFFFFAAAVFSVLSMLIWIGWLAVHAAGAVFTYVPFSVAPHHWHAHEMIYGYGGAVLAGFFLTAVPNWTGAPPSRSAFIAAIAALWLLGRLAVFLSAELPPPLVMVVDLIFIPVLATKIFMNLLKRPKPQNMLFMAILTLFFIGNLLVHLDWTGILEDKAEAGLISGLLTLCALIAVLGGRITPAFTRNALRHAGWETGLPKSHIPLEAMGIASALLLPVVVLFDPAPAWLAVIAAVAAISNGLRLAGWRVTAILDQPILWSLHLGFAMLVAGYAALAVSAADFGIGRAAALHILGIGAVGGMTLAVMSRAALGHTGRPLIVAGPIAIAYGLLAVAALVRSLGVMAFPEGYYTLMFVAGALWILVFVIFLLVYGPIVTSPRLNSDT